MTEKPNEVLRKFAEEMGYRNAALRYHITLKEIAHASNHDELMKAILKHKDVLRECM